MSVGSSNETMYGFSKKSFWLSIAWYDSALALGRIQLKFLSFVTIFDPDNWELPPISRDSIYLRWST